MYRIDCSWEKNQALGLAEKAVNEDHELYYNNQSAVKVEIQMNISRSY
jgi:hypothetical protein